MNTEKEKNMDINTTKTVITPLKKAVLTAWTQMN